jgi:lysosomal acid lipase/cholesteryl ester hydrolase
MALHPCYFISPARVWHKSVSKPKAKTFTKTLQACRNFTDMCAAFGYEAEEHVVQTKDGYLLCLHRICRKKGEPYVAVGSNLRHRAAQKPVVYLHHGLLMNSEVWVCQIDEKLSLPFRLVENGYDVWFGNNRGNKYSKKSLHHLSSKSEFWNFSMVTTLLGRLLIC